LSQISQYPEHGNYKNKFFNQDKKIIPKSKETQPTDI